MKNTYIFWRKKDTFKYTFTKSWVKDVIDTDKGELLELIDYEGCHSISPIRYLVSDLEIVKIKDEQK